MHVPSMTTACINSMQWLTQPFPHGEVRLDDVRLPEQEDVPHIHMVGGHVDAEQLEIALLVLRQSQASSA